MYGSKLFAFGRPRMKILRAVRLFFLLSGPFAEEAGQISNVDTAAGIKVCPAVGGAPAAKQVGQIGNADLAVAVKVW